MVGLLSVRPGRETEPIAALNQGFVVTATLSVAGLAVAVIWMLDSNWWLFAAGFVGIATSFLFLLMTEYYADSRFRPVKRIVEASKTGPATNVISGISVGFLNTPCMSHVDL
jgi:K(+)-stimulated pyrophosphate-energized sodium pump